MARSVAGAVSAKNDWPILGLFSDLRVRYGIKLGLAAVLALYWAFGAEAAAPELVRARGPDIDAGAACRSDRCEGNHAAGGNAWRRAVGDLAGWHL